MKKLFLFLLLIPAQLLAQNPLLKNEIGIGLGRIIYYGGFVPGDDFQIQSTNYSNATFTSPNSKIIHFFQSPTLYYQRSIHKHFKFVSSFNFISSKSSGTIYYSPLELPFQDFTTFFENKKVYQLTAGLSASTNYKYGQLYVGGQIGTSIQTGKKIKYNTDKNLSIKKGIDQATNDNYYNPVLQYFGELLMGGQVRLCSIISFNLEGGVVHTAHFAPISRLSINYHF